MTEAAETLVYLSTLADEFNVKQKQIYQEAWQSNHDELDTEKLLKDINEASDN